MFGRFIHSRADTLRTWHHRSNNFPSLASSGKHLASAALDPQRSPCFLATSERATSALSIILASKRQAGDCLCLRGEVGAGKSAFSRAYIRAVEEDDTVPVPSPTYLLQNIYEYTDGPSIYHYDLYRLDGETQLQRLDLHTSLKKAVNLIEWPDRLEGITPKERLDLEIKEIQARAAAHASELMPKDGETNSGSSEDDEAGDFADLRWRLICLQPYGLHWKQITAFAAAQQLSNSGLHLLTPEMSHLLEADPPLEPPVR